MYDNKPKAKKTMDKKLYGEEKLRQKKLKISVIVEDLSVKIERLFDEEKADTYTRKKTINALYKHYRGK